MQTKASTVKISSVYYDEKLNLYYAKSGVSLHHILIARKKPIQTTYPKIIIYKIDILLVIVSD